MQDHIAAPGGQFRNEAYYSDWRNSWINSALLRSEQRCRTQEKSYDTPLDWLARSTLVTNECARHPEDAYRENESFAGALEEFSVVL
ncbi:MAG: hypothetical protein E6J74_22710 [Deltaproteobacteria bacterium]|nr:MAG: hypothetical protein E6J74_22710 [Deltaproteobacteria bacterium]